jgi:hypothetical protein
MGFHKENRKKLGHEEGYVIPKGPEGFQYKDYKYYMYSGSCLLMKDNFTSEMSCAFIVKIGNGTEI